ncbi:MAG TPA: inositol monophosphatase family protein [Myxococcaceae bacterium]|nr:inositol monophosphatase family protein [Myxococcaceae bacterium]
MSEPSIAELLDAAQQGARRAGRVLADAFGRERTIEFKSNKSDLVTDADKASEAELLGYLRGRFPAHAVLAEESGLTRGSEHRWIVDPLDGTTNYAHRVPHFCVSVAVEGPGGVLAGAIYDPLRDELFSAGRGLGATVNGARLQASSATTLEQSVLCTGFPYDVREKPEAPLGLFNRLIRRAQGVRRMGSAALDLAYVAAGRFDGFFEFGLKPWDIAAGALLIWEAGGRMTQVDGAPLDLMCGDVLACAPGIQGELGPECARFLSDIAWKPRRFAGG